MTDAAGRETPPDDASIAAFAESLSDYAATLNARDQTLLAALLARALDPVDRVRFYPSTTTLSEREEAFVQALLDERSPRT